MAHLDIRQLKPTKAFDTFWRFAERRQAIYKTRVMGMPAPWTDDPILQKYKFTNAYRASDRVSQYLISKVIYRESQNVEEVLFRTLLFKIFNKIETWQLLQELVGPIEYKTFKKANYVRALDKALDQGRRIYSAAYIMAPGSGEYSSGRKHEAHLSLLTHMLKRGLPTALEKARSLQDVFLKLKEFPMVGDFLGFQLSIDINYSNVTRFDEMDFVVAGPGALSGIRKCFSNYEHTTPENVIRLVTETQHEAFSERNLQFSNLWGRDLQLIDVQNLFCEVVGSSRVDLQACKLEYSIVSPK